MYQQRWIYLTIAVVIGTLILLMAYQTLTQAVFPWNLLALVAAVSLACLALMVLGKTAFTRHDLKDGWSIANRVAAGMVVFHSLGMVGILAYDLWFQDEMHWPFYIGYGLPLYLIGFFLILGKYRASAHAR